MEMGFTTFHDMIISLAFHLIHPFTEMTLIPCPSRLLRPLPSSPHTLHLTIFGISLLIIILPHHRQRWPRVSVRLEVCFDLRCICLDKIVNLWATGAWKIDVFWQEAACG